MVLSLPALTSVVNESSFDASLQALQFPAGVSVSLTTAIWPSLFPTIRDLMRQEQVLPEVFWYHQGLAPDKRGAPEHCMTWWESSLNFVVLMDGDPVTEIAGMLWATDVRPQKSATVHAWYRRKAARCFDTRRVSRAMLRWAFATQGWKCAWASVGSRRAAQHAEACGGTLYSITEPHPLVRATYRDTLTYRFLPAHVPAEAITEAQEAVCVIS
jgi:hypothetical protein